MEIRSKLYKYISELDGYRREKSVAMESHIVARLNKSVESYVDDLCRSCDYVDTKSPVTTMRTVTGRR